MSEANVNLMLKNATVSYDPAVTTPEHLVEVIRATGYGAELASPDRTAFEEQEAQDSAQEEEFRTLRTRALTSFGLAVVAMLLSMPLMAEPINRSPG